MCDSDFGVDRGVRLIDKIMYVRRMCAKERRARVCVCVYLCASHRETLKICCKAEIVCAVLIAGLNLYSVSVSDMDFASSLMSSSCFRSTIKAIKTESLKKIT